MTYGRVGELCLDSFRYRNLHSCLPCMSEAQESKVIQGYLELTLVVIVAKVNNIVHSVFSRRITKGVEEPKG